MIPKNYIVIFEDNAKSEEFAYSPAEACEQAIIIWSQYNESETKPPKIVSIRPADEVGVQALQTEMLLAMAGNVRKQIKELLK